MSFEPEIYVCIQCQKRVQEVEQVLVVDESSPVGFCSEPCIVDFYKIHRSYFEEEEKKFRKERSLTKDLGFKFLEHEEEVIQALYKPDEVWQFVNELGENIYSSFTHFEKEGKELSMICLCFIYQGNPSFLIHHICTEHQEIKDYFRWGDKLEIDQVKKSEFQFQEGVEDIQNQKKISLSSEEIGELEQKKSSLLAEHLEKRESHDIAYEDFELYHKFLGSTLDEPDEVYKDSLDGETLFTYVKIHAEKDISFYYIVLCSLFEGPEEKEEELLIPLFSFPTLDGELYKKYQKGEKIEGALKN